MSTACCRTGDEKAATFLFNEMVRSPGYRPRVPPYNTMMQFYISSQPDREKALSYFDAMLRARVAPTAHTYKLLLDAYGSLEPGECNGFRAQAYSHMLILLLPQWTCHRWRMSSVDSLMTARSL